MSVRVTAVGEGTSLFDRKRRAGQRLVIGFEAAYVTDDLKRLIADIRPAGFILFKRNVEEPAQVRELNRELQSLTDPHRPALLSVDQEGGRVQRIREPATVWPPMRVVGQAEGMTADIATAMAIELRAMGFNLDFAPVADVDSNPANPVIGDRSFGREAAEVAAHMRAFIPAMQAQGVITCAKHFPGHGDTKVDSHFDLPIVEEELPMLERRERVPFAAAVDAGVGSIMTAHVVFPVLDEEWPATLSSRVVPRWLRRDLSYDGVVFSDDLEMKAVAGRWDVPTIVQRATMATVDVLLCCRDPGLQLEAFEAMVRAQEDDAAFARACEDSEKRVQAMRERYLLGLPPAPPLSIVGCAEHRMLAELARQRGGS
jgi:beta-N-acetylhexosaminidase